MRKPPAPGKTLITFCPIKSSFASSASSVSRPCAHGPRRTPASRSRRRRPFLLRRFRAVSRCRPLRVDVYAFRAPFLARRARLRCAEVQPSALFFGTERASADPARSSRFVRCASPQLCPGKRAPRSRQCARGVASILREPCKAPCDARPTLSAAPETYADDPDAYTDGGRKANAAGCRASKNAPLPAPHRSSTPPRRRLGRRSASILTPYPGA